MAEDGLNADLASALKLPVLLVAEDKLGVQNHVLLNIEALEMYGLDLAGIVLNNPNNTRDRYMDNAADLRARLDCDVFINLPCAKSHTTTGVTLGMKNLMGIIWEKSGLMQVSIRAALLAIRLPGK